MRIQRKLEAWRRGEPFEQTPMRWVPLRKIPESFIHFVWASEDQRFFEHNGFDFVRIREAIEEAQDRKEAPRALSTITMQCARTLFLWQGRSYFRKALEAYYTLWMELLMSKRRILELYLNHIEFGPGIYGIGAAARKYFGTTPNQLSRGQMLALAAILPNPLKWSPVQPDEVVIGKIRRVERLASQVPFPGKELQRK
jgi:monofunctional glycosyltransferase